MKILGIVLRIPFLSNTLRYQKLQPVEFSNIIFPNPLGVAAGFDKNAEYVESLHQLGFGYVEIGTVTPLPQEGNPKPRLFRLKKDRAIMNRMGFNNLGVKKVVENLKKYQDKNFVIGGNIGKNKWTPNEEAHKDYRICFETLYDYVSYFVVNVSSPNTPNLRALQDKETLIQIFDSLQEYRSQRSKMKPIFLKIAPDLNPNQLDDILTVYEEKQIDALIVSNTTIDYDVLTHHIDFAKKEKMGGISGEPIIQKTNYVIQYLMNRNPKLKIIGVGGIYNKETALEKIHLGCSLIQVYTGFIYKGPALVKDILR